MSYRYPMKEVAFQAGVSLATVDRVLNNRPGVRETTKKRIAAAIQELERQYGASNLAGRRLSLDVVMEAPDRFSSAVRRAFEAELPGLRPANVTVRFHLAERWDNADLAQFLRAIRRRGTHGIVLKAPSTKGVAAEARRMMADGIPVVTFVTDLPETARNAYIGIENHKAGATAAGLMAPMLFRRKADVLVTMSSVRFSGEDERVRGFVAELNELAPSLGIVRTSEGMGLEQNTRRIVAEVLDANPNIGAVYSVGGANLAVCEAFEAAGRPIHVFGAHDLDRANRALLSKRKLTFVIDHDLRQDARTAIQIMLHHHRMLPNDIEITRSRFTVVTPQSL